MTRWATPPVITIEYGAALTLVGLIAYFAFGAESWTALIPTLLGLPVLVLGTAALALPRWHRALMIAAAAIGVLAFIGTAPGLGSLGQLMAGEEVERPVAVASQSLVAIVSVAYLALMGWLYFGRRRPTQG